jgi:hypothetical protein
LNVEKSGLLKVLPEERWKVEEAERIEDEVLLEGEK